jgi:hypothetical protein
VARVAQSNADWRPPGTLAQIALIGGLRWRLLRNSLRTGRAQVDLLVKILLGLVVAVFFLGVGLGLGAAAYFFVDHGYPGRVGFLLWGVFLAWLILPALFAMGGGSFETRTLLVFPLRFPTFYLLDLATGLLDPVGLAAIFWLGCIGAGMTAARAELLPWVATLLAIFAIATLLLTRLISSWLDRLLATRRGREMFFLIFISLSLSGQLIGVSVDRWGKDAAGWIRSVRPALSAVLGALPPGVSGLALEAATRREPGNFALGLLVLGAYGGGFAFMLRRRLAAQARGDEAVEGTAPEKSRAQIVSGWELPGVPATVTAMFEKEVRFLLRNAGMLVALLVPLFITALVGIAWGTPQNVPAFLVRSPQMVYPSALGYALFVILPMVYNCFAFDGRGVQSVILAPVLFRDVLAGKNLMHAAVVAVQAVLTWLAVAALIVVPGAAVTAATLSGMAFTMLLHMSIGNVLSLYNPRRFDFKRFRQHQSGVTMLVMVAAMLAIGVVVGLIWAGAGRLGGLWSATAIFAGLSFAAWQTYKLSLDHCTRLAPSRREVLTSELCKQ